MLDQRRKLEVVSAYSRTKVAALRGVVVAAAARWWCRG